MDPIGLVFFVLIVLLLIAAIVLPKIERRKSQK